MTAGLEELREVFRDHRSWVALGTIQALEFALDGSQLLVKVQMMPDANVIVAQVGWASCGDYAGDFTLPEVNDLVLVALPFGDEDHAVVVSRLSSAEERIPPQAKDGSTVKKALSGKKLHLGSDTRVNIGKCGLIAPSEPLVLGNVLISQMDALYAKLDSLLGYVTSALGYIISGPVGVGNIGNPVPCDPGLITNLTTIKTQVTALKTQLSADKTQFVDTAATNFASQTVFTER